MIRSRDKEDDAHEDEEDEEEDDQNQYLHCNLWVILALAALNSNS